MFKFIGKAAVIIPLIIMCLGLVINDTNPIITGGFLFLGNVMILSKKDVL